MDMTDIKKTRKAKMARKPRVVKPRTEEAKTTSQENQSAHEIINEVQKEQTRVETIAKPISKPGRKERIPLGAPRQKLTAPTAKGKVRRWVNDDGGRVPMAEQGGYDFVTDNGLKIGDTGINSGNQDLGSRISRIVGTKGDGTPLRAFLMEIDEDTYKEDQTAKAQRVKETDDQIRHGNIERKSDDGRYVPRDGINYKP